MRRTGTGGFTLWLAALIAAALLLTACGSGEDTPPGDEEETAALDCSATGHPLSGCWWGNQIRIDIEISSMSIAVAFDGDGTLTAFEMRGPDAEENGVFMASGSGVVQTFGFGDEMILYEVTGDDFETPLYIITENTTTPEYVGFVQSNSSEGWLEFGMFQNTQPPTWPPSDSSDYDVTSIAQNLYRGVALHMDADDTYNAGGISTGIDGIGFDEVEGNLVTLDIEGDTEWSNGYIQAGGVLAPSETASFNASRGIFVGGFNMGGEQPLNGYLVPSPDGQAIAISGCQEAAPDCINPGVEMPNAHTFFTNHRITYQWFQNVIVE